MSSGRTNVAGRIATAVALAMTLSAMAPTAASAQRLPEPPTVSMPLFERITPSFSVAPREVFRRRGPRGARRDFGAHTLWISGNLHDLLPGKAAAVWPAPLRLSVGRRSLGDRMPSEYIVGLDLDAARLPGTHPAWQKAKQVLHVLRLPGPALVVTGNGTRMVGLYW